jgi:hypothetical protein
MLIHYRKFTRRGDTVACTFDYSFPQATLHGTILLVQNSFKINPYFIHLLDLHIQTSCLAAAVRRITGI